MLPHLPGTPLSCQNQSLALLPPLLTAPQPPPLSQPPLRSFGSPHLLVLHLSLLPRCVQVAPRTPPQPLYHATHHRNVPCLRPTLLPILHPKSGWGWGSGSKLPRLSAAVDPLLASSPPMQDPALPLCAR